MKFKARQFLLSGFFIVYIMKKFDYKRAFLNWLQLNGIYRIYFTNYYGGRRGY